MSNNVIMVYQKRWQSIGNDNDEGEWELTSNDDESFMEVNENNDESNSEADNNIGFEYNDENEDEMRRMKTIPTKVTTTINPHILIPTS